MQRHRPPKKGFAEGHMGLNTPTRPRHKRIQHWDDERGMGNSLIVSLVPGWKFASDPMACEHVRGFDGVAEAMKEVRSSIACACPECLSVKRIPAVPDKYFEVHAPCKECPFMKTATRGYFGPYSREHYLQSAHSEAYITCHMTAGKGEKERHCTGACLYRENAVKHPRVKEDQEFQEAVVKRFGTRDALDPRTFMARHSDEAVSWWKK